MEDQPQQPSRRRKGYYARQIEIEAESQGLTVEEYGVYKGPAYSGPKPYTSARGILFLAILITFISATMFVYLFLSAAGLVYVTEPATVPGVILPVIIVAVLPTVAWRQFFKERKAERLRKAAGKDLQPPTRRSSMD
ncbi:UNVERIFIED_ORG: hypothetical protein J2X79_001937 [Arthrobacter globiformis]|nr:hypothetical protein [Arthrobacter globiformis]